MFDMFRNLVPQVLMVENLKILVLMNFLPLFPVKTDLARGKEKA